MITINFQNLLPHAIEAFTEICGEEYRDIIERKINKALILQYYNIEGLENYIEYIIESKRKEFAIKFAEKIGINVDKIKNDKFNGVLSYELDNKLTNYIGSSFGGFGEYTNYHAPLMAFKENDEILSKRILRNKLKIINQLLGEEHQPITYDNFEEFIKTDEYLEILDKIEKLHCLYEELLLEYRKWEEQLKPYQDFINSEKKRKCHFFKIAKGNFFLEIYDLLPKITKDILSTKKSIQKINSIYFLQSIEVPTLIEYFSNDNIEKLKSPDINLFTKENIIYKQTLFLKNLGITIPNEDMLECNSEEDVNNYLKFLEENNIKQYLPTPENIKRIAEIREKVYEETLKNYITSKDDILDINKIININDFIYNILKNNLVCTVGSTRTEETYFQIKTVNFSTMFFTIRTYDGGFLSYSFMHECGHIIEQNINGSGFESSIYLTIEKNPYDNKFRKYEKFNETINDILTIEAITLLNNKGIYLIEPKEYTNPNTINNNTHQITKELLYPLLKMFRKEVISAKINTNQEELTQYIGKENFEELVDAVNKVDYLARNGVIPKINNQPDDDMVKEYHSQVKRVEKIYENIKDYFYKYNETRMNHYYPTDYKPQTKR